jgi:hypothetical protein
MTQVQSWTLALVAMVALVAGVLLATGAVSWAQEGSPTPSETPAATTAPDDGSDDSEGDSEDGKNCPEREEEAASETSDA